MTVDPRVGWSKRRRAASEFGAWSWWPARSESTCLSPRPPKHTRHAQRRSLEHSFDWPARSESHPAFLLVDYPCCACTACLHVHTSLSPCNYRHPLLSQVPLTPWTKMLSLSHSEFGSTLTWPSAPISATASMTNSSPH